MLHFISLALLSSLCPRFGPYFIEPVIAGINSKDEPFIAASDVVGCLNFAKDFVVSGTAADKLFGMAEGLWEPDLVSCSSVSMCRQSCHTLSAERKLTPFSPSSLTSSVH